MSSNAPLNNNMEKLDAYDLKILFELSLDCRQPLKQIAKRLKLSREVVDYRIKRLLECGVIQQFFTEIDLRSLGFTKTVVYLELIGATKKQEDSVCSMLANHPLICWLAYSTGKWSFIFDVHSRDSEHLASILDDIKSTAGPIIGEMQLATVREYSYQHSKFFSQKDEDSSRIFKRSYPINPKKVQKLSQKDLEILRVLCKDGRASWVEIAHISNQSPEAVALRVKRLIGDGVINRFSLFVDVKKLGFAIYNVRVSLSFGDKQLENAIISYLRMHPHVCFYYRPLAAAWDLEFGVFVKNPDELRDVLRSLRERYPGKIKIKDTMLFYEEITSPSLPRGIFQSDSNILS